MIYGLNFNGSNIPDYVRRRFAQRKSFPGTRPLALQGVCNTQDEVQIMRMQADNGRRIITAIGPRIIHRIEWFGIYVL